MNARKPPPPVRRRIRGLDLLVLAGTTALVLLASANIYVNMDAAGVTPGFGFLFQEAGFNVSEALIPFSSNDSYALAIVTGLLNTLFLAVVCLVLATVIGTIFGLISVGPSPVGRGLALSYVEVFRNIPKLLVLLVLFVVAVNGLPHVREAFSVGPFHLSNRSINFPVLAWSDRFWIPFAAFVIGLAIAPAWAFWKQRHQRLTGRDIALHPVVFPLLLPLLSIWLYDVPVTVSVPEMSGFDFEGGGRLSMQFGVIAITLGIYHGAQIAEVMRGGLQAVPKGQSEAAKALGLKPLQRVRLVIFPQVIRIIVPPICNQYVNLIKNTSISIAVGYSDLMSVSGTIINQSFKPLEMMLVTMALYLAICLSLTTYINRLHRRLTLRETR